MTADAFADDVQKCKAAGMNDHIAKPVNPPKIMFTRLQSIYIKTRKAKLMATGKAKLSEEAKLKELTYILDDIPGG